MSERVAPEVQASRCYEAARGQWAGTWNMLGKGLKYNVLCRHIVAWIMHEKDEIPLAYMHKLFIEAATYIEEETDQS